jgi:hypothetical protein
VIQRSSTVPKEVVGISFGTENVNKVFNDSPPFLSYDSFYVGVSFIFVIVNSYKM